MAHAPVTPAADPFGHFTPRLSQLARQGQVRRYRRGTLLIREGEPGGSLYFVLSGMLRAYTAREDGQEFTFGFYGVGETLGELSLDGGVRSAHVTVETPAECSHVDAATLRRCIAQDPALAFELLAVVARRARLISTRARDLALTDAYGRLVVVLRTGSVPQPDGTACMAYPLTQEKLARQIGCSRTMVTRLLGDLVKGQYLRQEQREQGRVWVTLRPLPARW